MRNNHRRVHRVPPLIKIGRGVARHRVCRHNHINHPEQLGEAGRIEHCVDVRGLRHSEVRARSKTARKSAKPKQIKKQQQTKIMKKLFTFILALCASFAIAADQPIGTEPTPIPVTPTTGAEQVLGESILPMVSSPSVLRAHALSLVTEGSCAVYGSGLQYTADSNTFVSVQGKTPNEIMGKMRDNQFTFPLLDPSKDQVSMWAQLTTSVGQYNAVLFEGYAPAGLAQKGPDGKLFVPTPVIEMRIAYETPVFVGESIQWASLYYRDDAGNIQWGDNIRVDGGWMFFQGQYAGKGGQIILYNQDGTQQIVDIETGRQVVPQTVAMTAQVYLNNYIEYSDAGVVDPVSGPAQTLNVALFPSASWDRSDAPVIRVDLAKKRSIAVFGGSVWNGNSVEVPTISAMGPSGQIVAGISTTDGYITIPTDEAGTWSITFDYLTLFGADVDPSPPYYGGYYDGKE